MAKRKRSLHVLPEPDWSKLSKATTQEQRKEAFNFCLYFVHYEIQDRTGVPHVKKWMRQNWDAESVKKILKLPDPTFYSAAKYAYCWNKLGWMPDDVSTWLNGCKEEWLEKATRVVKEKKTTGQKVVSIRPNLANFANAIDDSIDIIIDGNDAPDTKALVENFNLNRAEITEAVSIVEDMSSDFRELNEGTDAQLKEAYSHIKKVKLRKLLKFFDDITVGLSETKQANRITRIRRKRPVDKNKLVKKLRYTAKFPELNLTSVDPVEIIGASEVWIYDTTRKRLGVYASEYAGTLSVKGTVIDNYSLSKSYEKTVRKPEKVTEFMQCRKNGLHKFMTSIRGKQFPVKTRSQPSMVILKVIK